MFPACVIIIGSRGNDKKNSAKTAFILVEREE